jgi:putative DNA primase/helicase
MWESRIKPEKPFHRQVAERLIEQLKEGRAPWQKPWEPGDPDLYLPNNPTTGNRYKGINAVHLMSQGYGDPRWMTYVQARGVGAQVRKGEKGTRIQYWKFQDERPERDENGKPVLDGRGDPVKVSVTLERPRVFHATVFNADQIDGLPEIKRQPPNWNPIDRAEKILKKSGAAISHRGGDRAFYRPSTDNIFLPDQSQFASADRYYAAALHELGHWTGHPSRLARDLSHPFGSEGYAREELRAEISSMLVGDALGIGHDPGQHAAYVGSWIKVLQDDPMELFRAAADAEKIHDYVLGLERKQIQEQAPQQLHGLANIQEAGVKINQAAEGQGSARENSGDIAKGKTWLAVPYNQKEAVKAIAGKLSDGTRAINWDKRARCWYAQPGADLGKLNPWIAKKSTGRQKPDIRDEFAAALRSLGCVVAGEHPIMDGQSHRITVDGDKRGERSGFYVGHLDGHPAGYMKNNRTNIAINWKSKGYALSPEEKAKLQAEASAKIAKRVAGQERLQESVAHRVGRQMDSLNPVKEPTPYLLEKGIGIHDGIFTDGEGRETYIPAYDAGGKLWTMQYIREDGIKRFAKDGRKGGCFHPVGGFDALPEAPVLVVAEGYATAASLADGLGQATVAAFDSGNLPRVVKTLHEKYPDKPVIVAGDDDRGLEAEKGINPGRSKAEEAAKAVGGQAIFPIFAPGEAETAKLTDFNDLARKSALGEEAVERQVKPLIDRVLNEKQRQDRQNQKQRQEKVQEQRPRQAIRIG